MPDVVSFIVSSRGRPKELASCLASLALQDDPHEVIVAATTENPKTLSGVRKVCKQFDAQLVTPATDNMFQASEYAVERCHGDWLVFPNDDSYYVPFFSRFMLAFAIEKGWDLLYCDCLYDPRMFGHYDVFKVKPAACRIDKVCIMVKRKCFEGFPYSRHPQLWTMCDGFLVHKLVKDGVPHGKVKGVMAVHN